MLLFTASLCPCPPGQNSGISNISSGAPLPWIPHGRLLLFYIVSSFGRGKKLFLREAARNLCKIIDDGTQVVGEAEEFGCAEGMGNSKGAGMPSTSRLLSERGVMVLAENFNGSYRVSPASCRG